MNDPLANPSIGYGLAQSRRRASALNWWQAGGATGCVGAWRAKGAATYESSKIDLSGSENNLTEGSAPSWSASIGWSFDGVSQYLKTGIVPFSDYSGFGQFSSYVSGVVFGEAGAGSAGFAVYPTAASKVFYYGSGELSKSPGITSGNLAVCGYQTRRAAYRNGASDGTIPSGSESPLEIYIGASSFPFPSFLPCNGTVDAVAIYNNSLSDTIAAAIASAMASL